MASLRTAMDSAFWDLNISTPQALDGVAKAVPGEAVPLDGAKGSKVLRIQQLSLLKNGFPLGIIPSYVPSPNHKELGSFALQSLVGKFCVGDWWVGLIGHFRPKKLISSIKAEVSAAEELDLALLKDTAKHFLDKSLYAINLCLQIPLTYSSSLLLSIEKHGERKRRCTKAMLFHKLPDHDITLEAAWPELFIDHKGKYWEVPESVSLDCSSLVSESGFRYRFGLHKNNGAPQAFDSTIADAPVALLPGVCAKAGFSYEKSKDLWRQKETKKDLIIHTEIGQYLRPAYDIRLKEPHAALSGIIGGTCEAWFGGGKGSLSTDVKGSSGAKDRGRFGVDLFGSGCFTFQHGKFRKLFGDLTRVDVRLDVASATALAKSVANLFRSSQSYRSPNLPSSSPRLDLIFQQQVVGPIFFRVDSKLSLESSTGGPQLEDVIYSLNYSLRLLQSGKVVAWYSPRRKEGMIELRVFEF
ncbi:UNVERIFIED_CONTAM: protein TRIGALACTOSYLDIACYLGLYCEROL 4, chloroplastic [Sesamum radiatum]|uniref:Protein TRIGALACTOSYLDIACYLGLYCEROL 4, chloroplastic n=1 Tax=Sesamum radiatum TaxID=300843 RepID=A0AAW2VJK5_SESRA